MALIPESQTTLSAIDGAVLQQAEDGLRPHLGASLIGRSCDRALWYGFRWAIRPQHPPRVLRLFARGHREETVLAQLLRDAGITVHLLDPRTGLQFRVSAHGGHFGGSLDGAALGLVESKAWHVLEFKTHNKKSFDALEKDGVAKAKPEHYAQMQIYMHLTGMERAYYLAVCKDDDRLHGERVKLDKPAAEALLARAERIIFASNPPAGVSQDPAWYECKFCDYHALCHAQQLPSSITCRSCAHATPERGGEGRWSCARWQADIPLHAQREACVEHRFIPSLLTFAQLVDADPDANWIEYETAQGLRFRNGPQGSLSFASLELAAMDPALIDDQMLDRIRIPFDAEVLHAGAA